METLKNIYYWFYRLWNYRIKIFPSEVKWFIQRGRRGYADCDVWDFHSYLSKVIYGGLRQLSKESYGCPGSFYDETSPETETASFQKWKDELMEISQGFRDYEENVLNNGKLNEMVYDGHEIKFDKNSIKCEPEVPEWKHEEYNKFIEEEKRKFHENIAPRFIKIYGNLWD